MTSVVREVIIANLHKDLEFSKLQEIYTVLKLQPEFLNKSIATAFLQCIDKSKRKSTTPSTLNKLNVIESKFTRLALTMGLI